MSQVNTALAREVEKFIPGFQPMMLDNVHFETVSQEKWSELLPLVFREAEWVNLSDKRENLYKRTRVKKASGQQLIPIVKEIKKIDDRMKSYLYKRMYEFYFTDQKGKRLCSISSAQFMKDSLKTDEEREKFKQILADMDSLLMVADVLESWIIDINDNLKNLGTGDRLDVFDGVMNAMKQLRSINSLYEGYNNTEEQVLFFDTVEGIERYLRERTKTFREQLMKIRKKQYFVE